MYFIFYVLIFVNILLNFSFYTCVTILYSETTNKENRQSYTSSKYPNVNYFALVSENILFISIFKLKYCKRYYRNSIPYKSDSLPGIRSEQRVQGCLSRV